MKISQVFKHFKGRKGSQVERRRGRRQEKGCERGSLTDVSYHLQIPRHYGTYPRPSEKGGLGLGPTRTEPEFEFSAKKR